MKAKRLPQWIVSTIKLDDVNLDPRAWKIEISKAKSTVVIQWLIDDRIAKLYPERHGGDGLGFFVAFAVPGLGTLITRQSVSTLELAVDLAQRIIKEFDLHVPEGLQYQELPK